MRKSLLSLLAAAAAMCLTVVAGAGAGTTARPTLNVVGPHTCSGSEDPVTAADFVEWTGVAYEFPIKWYGGSTFKPGLATAWKVAPGNKAITLTFRPNARFSDGSLLTASAVKNWLEYRWSVKGASNLVAQGYPPLRSIRVLGKFKLKATFNTPSPFLIGMFSREYGPAVALIPSPKALAALKANPNGSPLSFKTAGAGPYALDPKQSIAGDHCTFVANKYYYDQSNVHWSKIVFKHVGDPGAILAALQSGQAQVGEGNASTSTAAKAAGLTIVMDHPADFDGFDFLEHGAVQKALADVRVRQALNYALDRKTITKALFGPYAVPTSNPFPTALPYDPKIDDYYNYDPAKAKALLTAAGYPNGFTMKVTTAGSWFSPAYKTDEMAQACVKYWAAIGIDVKLDVTQTAAEFTNDYTSNTYSLFAAPYGDFQSPILMYASRLGPDQHGWKDTVMGKLWVQGLRAGIQGTKRYNAVVRKMILRSITNAEFVTVWAESVETYVNPKAVTGVTEPADLDWNVVDWAPK
jgi:peptide/nickel transport system substrate-binding protein